MAAAKGHVVAHMELALVYYHGKGCNKNINLGYKLMTFAAHHGFIRARYFLGVSYLKGGSEGISINFEKAKYWLEQVVHSPELELVHQKIQEAYPLYASVLLHLLSKHLDGMVNISGHSPIPQVLYWFNKAKSVNARLGPVDIRVLQNIEDLGKMICHGCEMYIDDYRDVHGRNSEFKRCTRCKFSRYCGRQCQLDHFTAGHKKDCKTKYGAR